MVYPADIDTFETILPAAQLSESVGGRTHRQQHNDVNAAVVALETAVGVTGSTDAASLRYQLSQKISNGTLPKSVKDYGAVGDGVTDDTAAIESALAGGGLIAFPDGTYKISHALRVFSNSAINLSPAAVIVNTKANANTYEWAAFAVGVMHPACFAYANKGTSYFLPAHDIAGTVAGQSKLIFNTAGDSSNYTVGAIVVARSIAEHTRSGYAIPDYIQTAIVTEVGAGYIVIDIGLTEGITNGCVSPFGATTDSSTGELWRVADNVHIRGGRYDTRGIIWGRGAMYRSTVRDCVMDAPSELVLTLNLVGRSVIENIIGTYTSRALELKSGSHDVSIRGCQFASKHDASVTLLAGIEFGEQSRDISLDRVLCMVSGDATADAPPISIPGRRIVVKDSIFSNLSAYAGSTVIQIPSYEAGDYPCKTIKLENVEVIGNAARNSYIRCGYTASTQQVDYLVMQAVRVRGAAPVVAHIIYENTTANVFTSEMGDHIASRYNGILPSGNIQTVGVGFFSAITGSPVLALFGGRGNCWAMDSAATEEIGATVPAPPHARSVSAELIFTNLGAGAGNVRWDITLVCIAAGGLGSVATSQENLVTAAPVKDYTKSLQFYGSNKVSTDTDMLIVRVRRMGADAADTLANDAGVLGVRLRWY